MIKKMILSTPFQLTSNYPETATWYLCGNELCLISSLLLHLTFLALSLSASHRLFPPSRLFGKGRKEGGEELGCVEVGKKRELTHTQRPANRDSGAHSAGEKHLPGRQVNQGHTIIIGGPRVKTDLCSAWTKRPCWHCIYNINPLEKVCVRDGGVPFSS